MTPRLPSVSGKQVVKALGRAGFAVVRISGCHHRLVHKDDPTRVVTVPVHGAASLKRGTLASILRQSGVSVEELAVLL